MPNLESVDRDKVLQTLNPPKTLVNDLGRADDYQRLFDLFVMPSEAKEKGLSVGKKESLEDAQKAINTWLEQDSNETEVTETIKWIVSFFSKSEKNILSESHDMYHVSEMATSYLDDKGRGVDTDNATLFCAVGIHLLHDLGRRIEEQLSIGQLDLHTNLHHDTLSFVAAKRMMDEIKDNLSFPDQVKKALYKLILTGLRRFGNLNDPEILATSYEPDRRQLSGSSAVARDMTYMLFHSGMDNKTLSPSTMFNWPEGYVHFDSGGFFGQQRMMVTGVFRDESIRSPRKLDDLYDDFAIEAVTIVLLGCGKDEKLLRHAFDTNMGTSIPSLRQTIDNLPWYPKEIVPGDMFGEAMNLKSQTEKEIPDNISISTDDIRELSKLFLEAYSTIIEPEHLKSVQDDLASLPEDERRRWVRIMHFAHNRNLERIKLREDVWEEENNNKSFMGKILKPFMDILDSKEEERVKLSNWFEKLNL